MKIHFGAFAPDLTEQLANYEYNCLEIATCQGLADSITDLCISNILPAGQVEKARKKLMKRIAAATHSGPAEGDPAND